MAIYDSLSKRLIGRDLPKKVTETRQENTDLVAHENLIIKLQNEYKETGIIVLTSKRKEN